MEIDSNEFFRKVLKMYCATKCLLEGPKRFNELHRRGPYSRASSTSKRLDEGENLRMIKKEKVAIPGKKGYSHYMLTEQGQSAYKLIEDFEIEWN